MIEFKNVSFSYQGQVQGGIKGLDLTVKDGECVLFCGRSGCGKTTVTRLVNGLIPNFYPGEAEGEVLLDGKKIRELPMYQIAEKVGSVFQNPRTQFFNMDTDSEIAFGIENEACPQKEMAERVKKTAEDLHIKNLCGRNIFELSGGEKQKIAFASVYTMNPDVYLLDEPSSNLDVAAVKELKEHLKLIKAQKKTILIAEHRLYYLMDLADRIVYLDEGEVKGIYTPKEFLKIPDEKRHQMGLRAVDLTKEKPQEQKDIHTMAVLELKDVTLKYKKTPVLSHVSLSAGKGEVIAVAGHNGAGKSTFSKGICGLHKKREGIITWENVPQKNKQLLRHSYLVMQDVNYELFAESVKAECCFGIKDPDEAFVEKNMEDLDLLSIKDRHPNTLSGGQKQRVAVADSMICQKELLIFDEPTSGLDYDSMVRTANLIQKLSEQGKLIFVVTHDYEFVCRTCTRVLNFGKNSVLDDFMIDKSNTERLKEIFSVS